MEHLDELDHRGYRYYFQFTLNDYPTVFEPHFPPVECPLLIGSYDSKVEIAANTKSNEGLSK